jgi:hypothetical protein
MNSGWRVPYPDSTQVPRYMYIPLAPALSHLPRMMIISGDFGVSGFNFVIL